jgi:hypothetical protein
MFFSGTAVGVGINLQNGKHIRIAKRVRSSIKQVATTFLWGNLRKVGSDFSVTIDSIFLNETTTATLRFIYYFKMRVLLVFFCVFCYSKRDIFSQILQKTLARLPLMLWLAAVISHLCETTENISS